MTTSTAEEVLIAVLHVLLDHYNVTPAAHTPPAPALHGSVPGLFVSLHTLPHHTLRGCIGSLSRTALDNGHELRRLALAPALRDPRFRPLTAQELPRTALDVALLSEQTICDPFDWVPGTHGVYIGFQYRGHNYTATFLPQVASEQGWSVKDTLENLVTKAGVDTSFDNVDVTYFARYTTSTASLNIGDYIADS